MAFQSAEAMRLRERILASGTASASLIALAADPDTWVDLHLASLEEAGLLRADSEIPPIREQQNIQSLVSTLATGILFGPVGEEIRSSGELPDFFDQLERWYGEDGQGLSPLDLGLEGLHGPGRDHRMNDAYHLDVPVPALADFEDYDLGFSRETRFQDFRVFVPWVGFEDRGAGLPPDFQVTGEGLSGSIAPVDGEDFQVLDFTEFYEQSGVAGRLASLTGPITIESGGYVPVGAPLPYSVDFRTDSEAAGFVHELRVLSELDENLDVSTFQLGDIQIGDIQVHIPDGRGTFQSDFDFSEAKGFNLRVSGGIDPSTRTASWLIQAIDPLTGAVLEDAERGLLPANDARGSGAGFVSYSVEVKRDAQTGAEVSAQARVLFDSVDNALPQDTLVVTHRVDAAAPTSEISATRISDLLDDYRVEWNVSDDEAGSGFRHVTLYVATDGGDFEIWRSRVADASGSGVFQGEAGHSYEFLALASDQAGNVELPDFGISAPSDGASVDLGGTPTVPGTTPPNFGSAPAPDPAPASNALFAQAEQQVPNTDAGTRPSEFDFALNPFRAEAFATGFASSGAGIGPMAIAEGPDARVYVSGGADRSEVFRFDHFGGNASDAWAHFDEPIYAMAFDVVGNLWATTGGGALLQIDAASGEVVNRFGDGLTLAVAVEPATGLVYVSSGMGVEIFDPATQSFSHYSRDLDLRVGSLAFANDGSLWAVTWPDRHQVVRFNERARVEVMLEFASDVDSIAFGGADTLLADLLFVSHNTGERLADGGAVAGSELTMVDLVTLRRVALADGGSRGDGVATTGDGRVLLSQSRQVDVLSPIVAPAVIATTPVDGAFAALPVPHVTVQFSQDMLTGDPAAPDSVLNPALYSLTGLVSGASSIRSIVYDSATRTAILTVNALAEDVYRLEIDGALSSALGQPLGVDHVVGFRTVADLSAETEIAFSGSRIDRANGTVSYEVSVTNTGSAALVLPLMLVLDPPGGFQGAPSGTVGQTPEGAWLIALDGGPSSSVRLQPGETTSGHTVSVTNPEDARASFDASVSATAVPNTPPVFTSSPVLDGAVGGAYVYPAAAVDADAESVVFWLHTGPEGMAVDPVTGLVSWVPSANDDAETVVVLQAYDAGGGVATQEFTIAVVGGNHAPSFGDLPAVVGVAEGGAIELVSTLR